MIPSIFAWLPLPQEPPTGSCGARTSASGPGGPFARTTATTATPGDPSPTTTPGAGPTAGTRTGWPGISDRQQYLCFALALWNGNDPILKERLFGLTGPEGNHGEDVKEYYYYLDATPTHSYLRMRYTYPQGAFPYDRAGRPANRAARPPRARIRTDRHRRLRRRLATSTSR